MRESILILKKSLHVRVQKTAEDTRVYLAMALNSVTAC